jgi:hypothetical protein
MWGFPVTGYRIAHDRDRCAIDLHKVLTAPDDHTTGGVHPC